MPILPSTTDATNVVTVGRVRQKVGSVLTRSAQPLEQTLDRAANQVQQNTARATAQARALPFAGGNIVTGVAFVSGVAVSVPTGLQTLVQGWWLVNPRSLTAGTPTALNTSPTAPAKGQLLLTPQGSYTADVFCF